MVTEAHQRKVEIPFSDDFVAQLVQRDKLTGTGRLENFRPTSLCHVFTTWPSFCGYWNLHSENKKNRHVSAKATFGPATVSSSASSATPFVSNSNQKTVRDIAMTVPKFSVLLASRCVPSGYSI